MRRFHVVLVATALLVTTLACTARMQWALERTWDDMTTTPRRVGGTDVIMVCPIQ
jgi:hypothetical protein